MPISANIKLVTHTNDYDYLAYKKLNDIELDKGPMGGIYSALANSDSEINMILSCDIPLISTEILLELIQKHNSNFDVTVFEDEERVHPLIGIYSRKLLPILKKAIDENELKMMLFLTNVNTQRIPIENDKKQFFKNINTLEELNELNTNFIQN